jgi:hypothetical protein
VTTLTRTYHFTTVFCLFVLFCVLFVCLFCVLFVVVCRVPHPMKIVKFTYHIGDNVKFKCGGENWVRSSQNVSKFSNFFKFQ